jgi:Cys-tRNA(Pro)/Cys-tRNA(Cys) deacylase
MGYILGRVSPLGQKRKLKTVIDESAQLFESIYISAGHRGLELEISPLVLTELTQAKFNAICN